MNAQYVLVSFYNSGPGTGNGLIKNNGDVPFGIAWRRVMLKTVNTTGPVGIRPHSEVTDRWLSH